MCRSTLEFNMGNVKDECYLQVRKQVRKQVWGQVQRQVYLQVREQVYDEVNFGGFIWSWSM